MSEMDGILNIYKEKGFTSHDVVAKMRGILKQKKIGHTGTLDPDAVGVLPVCLGKGTKLCSLLTDWEKQYEAVLRLGIMTDTEDMTGEILKTSPCTSSKEEVFKAIHSFVGSYDQTPPMYSAKKVNGKKLYEIAREGKIIERKPTKVKIIDIEIKEISLPDVTFTVTCSKGTYIRSLCRDIGEKLGCGGCMASLKRIRTGSFSIDSAITLKQLEEIRDKKEIENYLVPVDSVLDNYPKAQVYEKFEKLLYNGNPLFSSQFQIKKEQECEEKDQEQNQTQEQKQVQTQEQKQTKDQGSKKNQKQSKEKDQGQRQTKDQEPSENQDKIRKKLRIYDTKGNFIGLYAYIEEKKQWKPEKMFL